MLRKVISDSIIPKTRCITIDTWDTSNNCFKIKLPDSYSSHIKGITIKEIPSSTPIYDAIQRSGTLDHIDTSSFGLLNDLYPTISTGALTNTQDIMQKVGIVRKVHGTFGRVVLLDSQGTLNSSTYQPWEETTVVSSPTDTYTLQHSALQNYILVLLDGFPMSPNTYTKNLTGSLVTSLTFDNNLFTDNVVTLFYFRTSVSVIGQPWEETTIISSTTNTYTLQYQAIEQGILVLLDGFPMSPNLYTKNKTGDYVTSLTFDNNLHIDNVVTLFYTRV